MGMEVASWEGGKRSAPPLKWQNTQPERKAIGELFHYWRDISNLSGGALRLPPSQVANFLSNKRTPGF